MIRRIQSTLDHSNTVFLDELNEAYHSRHGALTESLYVYIEKGFTEAALTKNNIAVFEVGFGTGLNALLTLIEAEKKNIRCTYHSIEAYPLEPEIIHELDHKKLIDGKFHSSMDMIHSCAWDKETGITKNFTLKKIHAKLEKYFPDNFYDVIYFDAFAPDKQPELWTKNVFQKIYDCLNKDGIIVTYSSKGDVRRTLLETGFDVERLPGPPMKRHMLRGRKTGDRMSVLSAQLSVISNK